MIVSAAAALTPAETAEVLQVIASAAAADGASPVAEETLLHLRRPGRSHRMTHVLVRAGGRVAGYGSLVATTEQQPMLGEVAIAPDARDQGAGQALVEVLLTRTSGSGLAIWTHGRSAWAARLVGSMGFRTGRILMQMRRSLTASLPAPLFPPGYAVRPFRPGADDAALLEANAAAFPHLPDQGGWDQAALAARMAQPWFEPDGLLLLVERTAAPAEAETLAGFHWTKMHAPQPLGEVYVLALTPPYQRQGLAPALLVRGLRHLRERGASQAMLFVDQTNTPAVGLYRRAGFTEWDVDVLYVRDGSEPD